jgi:hypothetical protein
MSLMHPFIVLLLGLVLSGGCANAQIGQELEKWKAKKGIIEITEKKKYGENFTIVTSDGIKGCILEMWFHKGVCVYDRWMDRAGEPNEEYKELVWKLNFGHEKIVKKSERGWEGEGGNSISWDKTKNGMDVIVAKSKKMDEILAQEVRRQMGNDKKDGGVSISFQKQRVYSTDGEWSGTIRNGKIYGTDGTWEGSVRNGNVYGTDGTWGGRINGNGQIYNTDSQWKGSVR